MKIENQVCSRDQAKRLKELGIEQCGYFNYAETRNHIIESWTIDGNEDTFYSAFTVSELGMMLPKRLKATWKHPDTTGLGGTWESSCNCPLELGYNENKRLFTIKYALIQLCSSENEAVARAEMIIYLLEYNLITASEVNQRLSAA